MKERSEILSLTFESAFSRWYKTNMKSQINSFNIAELEIPAWWQQCCRERGNHSVQFDPPWWVTGEEAPVTGEQCCFTDGHVKSFRDLLHLPLRLKWSFSYEGPSRGWQYNPCMKPIWLSSLLAERALNHEWLVEKPSLQRLRPLIYPGWGVCERSNALCLSKYFLCKQEQNRSFIFFSGL